VFGYEICFGLLLSFVWLFIFPPFIHSAFRLCRARKESSLSSALLHLKLFLLALGWYDRKQEILMANIAMTIIYNGENYISVPFTMRKAARHQTSWKVFFFVPERAFVEKSWRADFSGGWCSSGPLMVLTPSPPDVLCELIHLRVAFGSIFAASIVLIRARKGLIMLGNLYLLIGESRGVGVRRRWNRSLSVQIKSRNSRSSFPTLFPFHGARIHVWLSAGWGQRDCYDGGKHNYSMHHVHGERKQSEARVG
jgi:hypothetical protein